MVIVTIRRDAQRDGVPKLFHRMYGPSVIKLNYLIL